jgi:transketolase
MSQTQTIDQTAINTIRTLAMDAVQAANSGHPGAPMGLAPVAYCLWQRFLNYDPAQPIWPNRDRFVLSVGHASMLLYSLLHLTGVKSVTPSYQTLTEPAVSLDAIKNFRQLDSRCPGHPEYRWTTGVETTTGPLGQGVAKGAYVLADGKPEVLIMATGSEVAMCIAAYERLKADGIAARVISMPSWEVFEQQDQAYKDAVMPPQVVARVAVEMASPLGWASYTGLHGKIIGMRSFGASAPLKDLQQRFGFSVESIVTAAMDQAAKARTAG